MNRKANYKNIDKWRITKRLQKQRYYHKTQNAVNSGRPWTKRDTELVMMHEMTDKELSALLGRSVNAIQVKRRKENRKMLRLEAI